MRNIIYSICILCILSCSKKSSNRYDKLIDKFPLEVTLKATDLRIPPILLRPSNMCIVDSFLIVTQERTDTIFSIFKLPNCEYLLSFGNRGRGPNELNNSSEFVTLGTVYGKYNSFAFANAMTRIQYYKMADIINKTFNPYKIESLPLKLHPLRWVTYIGDSLIFGAAYGGNMHLFKFNTYTKVLESYRDYPDNFPLLEQSQLRDAFGCCIAVKSDNSKLVVSYSNIGRIELYDLNNNNPIILSYKGFPSLEENTGLNKTSKYWNIRPELKIFCEKISATNKYIYARVTNDKYSTIYNAEGPNHNFIPELHIFDWSGNPIIKCKLDKYFSHYYAIDAADKYLYTLDDNIENVIRRYDLTKILPEQN